MLHKYMQMVSSLLPITYDPSTQTTSCCAFVILRATCAHAESEPVLPPPTQPTIYIYMITHIQSNKHYVGQSRNPGQRFKYHLAHPNKRMRKDVLQATPRANEAFTLQILGTTTSISVANAMEARYINAYNCTGTSGYNLLKLAGRAASQFRYLHDKHVI